MKVRDVLISKVRELPYFDQLNHQNIYQLVEINFCFSSKQRSESISSSWLLFDTKRERQVKQVNSGTERLNLYAYYFECYQGAWRSNICLSRTNTSINLLNIQSVILQQNLTTSLLPISFPQSMCDTSVGKMTRQSTPLKRLVWLIQTKHYLPAQTAIQGATYSPLRSKYIICNFVLVYVRVKLKKIQ